MRKIKSIITGTIGSLALGLAATPAQGQSLNLTGNLLNSCVLTIASSGTLTPSTDGLTISSENSGGQAGSITLVAIGLAPTVRFAAPTLTTPAGYSGTATPAIRYTSSRGASQAYTSAASHTTMGFLIDSYTVHGRVSSPTGFSGGQYNVQTVVTCEQ